MPGDGSRAARAEHGTREATALATSLNALDTRPGGNPCHGIPGADRRWYRLVFSYSEGPPAGVRFLTDCDPALGNGLLQANPTDAVREQVTRLAPP
ncbi:MAG: hypothetical protein HOY71_26065 [Nonomuraea sp.]|nr:hypothetical protein [Nonomuraea sp.]